MRNFPRPQPHRYPLWSQILVLIAKRRERKELTRGADGEGTESSLEPAQMSDWTAQDRPKEAERDPRAPRTDGPARARGEWNGRHNHNISNSSGAFPFSKLIQIHYLTGISQLLWTVDGQGLWGPSGKMKQLNSERLRGLPKVTQLICYYNSQKEKWVSWILVHPSVDLWFDSPPFPNLGAWNGGMY